MYILYTYGVFQLFTNLMQGMTKIYICHNIQANVIQIR